MTGTPAWRFEFVQREVESGGHVRPRFFRLLGDGFWPDVKGRWEP
jgi:hypothetical protein